MNPGGMGRRKGREGGGDKRKDGSGKGSTVAWFPDNAVRVPNPLRSGKVVCKVERLKVLPYLRNLSIWNQRKDVVRF